MDKPVRWMTVAELREELERTRAGWEGARLDLDAFLGTGKLPPPEGVEERHQLVQDELDRRASAPKALVSPEDPPVDPRAPMNPA